MAYITKLHHKSEVVFDSAIEAARLIRGEEEARDKVSVRGEKLRYKDLPDEAGHVERMYVKL